MAETISNTVDDLSCDIKLVDLANMACIGMLETGFNRRDVEALGYFMELLGERLRERFEQASGSPYDKPDVQPSAPRHLVEPLDTDGKPSTVREGER